MASTASEIIGKLMEELRTVAKTETIIGKEFKAGDFTLIPVSRITLGFGAGGGKGAEAKREGEGGGGGGGVCITPIAFIVVKGAEIFFHGIKRGGTLDAIFEKIPDLAEKILTKSVEQKIKKEGDEAP